MVALDALERGQDFLFGHGEVNALGVQVALGHGHDVQGPGHCRLIQAEQFPEHPFDAVAAHRAPIFLLTAVPNRQPSPSGRWRTKSRKCRV